jgi:type 1 glutamine amidotransferase
MKIKCKRQTTMAHDERVLAQAARIAFAACFILTAGAVEAAPKRVLVCSVTSGFFHGVIPALNTALQEFDEADARFEVVSWVTNPDIEVPKKPSAPRAPAENAPAHVIENYQRQKAAYEKQLEAWTPQKEAERIRLQKERDAAVIDRLAPLSPDALRANKIDLVIFNNTSGNLPLPDVDGFVRWIEEGGAFAGIHAAADTLKNDPRYTEMIQGIFDGHGPQVSAMLHAGDTEHPANIGIGKEWFIQYEEIYLFRGYDPAASRTLWYMKHHPNHPDQEGFFPIAWCRMQGRGRVFYTALGHRGDLVSLDPALKGRVNPVETAQQYRDHLLAGIMWALGLAEGSAEPNPNQH